MIYVVERREDEYNNKENDTDLFLVYSLNDLKMVYQKEVDFSSNYERSRPFEILMNSQNEVFASYRDGRIEQLDVLF